MKATTPKEKQTIHVPKFLTKTFDLLENKSHPHAIEWHNKGSSILIKDSLEFERILPRFFKHKKMASFVRQLNLYGFKKVKNSQNQFIYYNPKFQSGKRHLLKMMKRKSDNSSPIYEREQEDINEEVDDLVDENKELKKLHKESATRINALEIKLKEIAEQNLLLAEIAMKKENEIIQLKNKIAFQGFDESIVLNKSAQVCDSPLQKSFQPKGIFRPVVKIQSLASSNSDQEVSPKLNVVKNVIIKPTRDYDESDSDRKSEDSPAVSTHNYLSLFTQTIANSSGLRPVFQFKMDSPTGEPVKVL